VMKAVNATGHLRVSAEGEARGIDLFEHGISAYPEYVISAVGRPAAVVLGGTQHNYAVDPTVKMKPVQE